MAQALPEVPAEVWADLDNEATYPNASLACSQGADALEYRAGCLASDLGISIWVGVAMLVETMRQRYEEDGYSE
jgi:hypothetical protein